VQSGRMGKGARVSRSEGRIRIAGKKGGRKRLRSNGLQGKTEFQKREARKTREGRSSTCRTVFKTTRNARGGEPHRRFPLEIPNQSKRPERSGRIKGQYPWVSRKNENSSREGFGSRSVRKILGNKEGRRLSAKVPAYTLQRE